MASNAVIEPVSTASAKAKKADDNISQRAEEEDVGKLTDDQSTNDVPTVLKDSLDLAKVVDTDGGCERRAGRVSAGVKTEGAQTLRTYDNVRSGLRQRSEKWWSEWTERARGFQHDWTHLSTQPDRDPFRQRRSTSESDRDGTVSGLDRTCKEQQCQGQCSTIVESKTRTTHQGGRRGPEQSAKAARTRPS